MTKQPTSTEPRTLIVAGVLLVVLLGACGGGGLPSPTPGPSPTPSPIGEPLTIAQLKVALIDRFGPLWYCDPDFYPVARDDEQQLALKRFGEVQADAEAFAAILAQLELNDGGDGFTDEQKIIIYRAWKVLRAIALDPIGNGRYRFDYLAQPAVVGAAEGTRTAGTIDEAGTIEVEQQAPAGEPMCPICLARRTRINTPAGEIAVERLRIGDPVWTLDAAGRTVRGVVIAIGSTAAPRNHEVVHLVLADGRSVTASPGHPLAGGRSLGDLRVGDAVDGSTVVSAERLPYADAETFDILVSGSTGVYRVDGIWLGSTLRP
jgi:hypothetical protein